MKCKACEADGLIFDSLDLTIHIVRKHKMTTADYLRKYGGEIVDDNLKKQRIEARKNKYTFKCPICNLLFESQKGLENHINESTDIQHNHFVFNELNKEVWVECTECFWRGYSLVKHIEKHNIRVYDYKGQLRSKQCIEDNKKRNEEVRNNFIFSCPVEICKEKFTSEKALQRHLVTSKDISHNHQLYNETNKNTWVECVICKMRKNVLTRHLKDEHDMTIDYYRENYNAETYSDDYKVSFRNFIEAGAHSEKRRDKNISCKECPEKFSTQNLLDKHIEEKHSYLIYNESNKNDWVECQICSFRSIKISQHIQSKHSMTSEEYKNIYNSPVVSINHVEKINQNWGDLSENVQKRKSHQHKCAIETCSNIIVGEQMICSTCKLRSARDSQEEKFKDKIEGIDFVRCKCKLEDGKICDWPDTRITEHIKLHGFDVQSYKRMFGNDANLICQSILKKTAFRGTHSIETRKKQSHSHMFRVPWNAELTKNDHPSLQRIADKAVVRMGQLYNNNWSLNPLFGNRNGMKGKKPWCTNLTNETSDLVEKRSETISGINHHKSNFRNSGDIYDINKFIEQFREMQKEKTKIKDKKCFLCGSNNVLNVHHIHPESLFDKYDISAHFFLNLITLCTKCHSYEGQKVDKAILNSQNEQSFEQKFPQEFLLYKKMITYTENRLISYFPLSKNFIEKLDETQRSNLALCIFDELRTIGFPYISYSDEELLKDLENIEKNSCYFSNNELQNHNFSGSRFRENFIHEQYRGFLEIFQNDDILLKTIRNRLGLDWKNKPEFFNMSYKIIIKGFEVLFPKQRFSKYKATTAKWIIENFCEGKNVFDYSAGWGDRMLGTVAAGRNYIGVDTNSKLVEELNTLAEWLKRNRNCNIKMICGNSAEYNEPIEFAYSCPPYGNQEEYFGSSYLNDRDWLQKFMIPVIDMCSKNFINKGKFVCHLPVRLSGIVKNELNKKFDEVQIIKIFNTHDAYHGGKERQNEVILVYQKR